MPDKTIRKALHIVWIGATFLAYPLVTVLSKRGTDKNILCMPQLSRIGDIVCSTPVFYNIKKSYPDSKLTVLISKKALGIVKNNPRIDSFIIIEDYSFFGLINKLRSEKFTWSINLTATSINTCLSIWAGIPNRIKTVVETPPITERLTDWMSNYRLLYKNHTYLPQHHIHLLKFLDIKNPEDKKEVWTTAPSEEKVNAWKKSFADKKIVGISITAGNKIKELGDDRFEILIKKLIEIPNVIVCCIGSPADNTRIDALVAKIDSPLFIKATHFSLEELPALMKSFSLYIAVDTGPIYIAHALGVPLIDIIGPVDPTEQPPRDEKSIQILPKGDIRPSSFVFKKRGTPDEIQSALQATSIEEVFAASVKMIS
jgi:ADP-heptose:LPS heptosyltransferase